MFNTILENVLQKIHRHVKKKTINLVDDFNHELIKHGMTQLKILKICLI